MNKFKSFTPLMHKHEYEFIEKNLSSEDTLLEWGAGSSTLYFSGLVKNVISIEHDIDWVNVIKNLIEAYNVKNVEIHHIAAHFPEPKPCRYEQFKDYIHYPVVNKFKFTKVLIDGRARKYCAKYLYDTIDENVDVFIHDFNRPDYQKTLKYYDCIEKLENGQGIARLRKKKSVIEDSQYY